MDSPQSAQIKPFEPVYTAEVHELARAVVQDDFGAIEEDPVTEPDLQDLQSAYAPPEGRFLVALDDGAVVGTGGIRRLSDTDCEMARVYVASTHRRCGIASSMVGELLGFVRERKYKRVFLEIRPEMDQEAWIYQRYGFSDAEPEQAPQRPGRRFVALHL